MGSKKNLESAKRVLDAYNKRDWDYGLAGVAPDGVFSEVPFASKYEGHDGYRQAYEAWAGAFSDSELADMKWDDAGDNIYCRHLFVGTNDGELAGAPATGKPVNFAIVQHFQCKDGLVVKQDVYFDAMTMMVQLGHLPAPG